MPPPSCDSGSKATYRHEFGEGVVVDAPRDGWVRAFFGRGERQVPLSALRAGRSDAERLLEAVKGTPEQLRSVLLTWQAHALPLMEGGAALTSAAIDLLPHQVVLTHRIATAAPRRFLVADEVGLGKTVEAALLLRELASRGEVKRALMVVPAGLVNNWHRELNEVFRLDFEVFGSEGDITDRRSNAFLEEQGLPDTPVGRGEADLKLKVLRRISEEQLALGADSSGGEGAAASAEEAAVTTVALALPEERLRIARLLESFPEGGETKVQKLLRALGTLWEQNPSEKVVIFATYLGTVDLLSREIEATYPGQGVVVLRGGDHGAKLAAERRFRRADGPRVLVCTAAGREGINLQFARVLFNFDLPWNPMDVEQRIGRIHRYGQRDTAQVYNLVLSDTIEGRIFLLLDTKLTEIARALGKVNDQGNVAEDLRTQILGQLSERLSYERLYREALSDPELRRTQLELEAALANAREAREVVFELFQDLEGFSLDDYRPFADLDASMARLVSFLREACRDDDLELRSLDRSRSALFDADGRELLRFTTDRDVARETEIDLLGLDHPLVAAALARLRSTPPEQLGASLRGDGVAGVLTLWFVEAQGREGDHRSHVQVIATSPDGERNPAMERWMDDLSRFAPAPPKMRPEERFRLLRDTAEPMLERELHRIGLVPENGGYTARLIGWLEIANDIGSAESDLQRH